MQSADAVVRALKDPAITVTVVQGNSPASLLDRHQAARHLNVSVDTLDRLHKLRRGPQHVQIGRRRLYTSAALDAWVAAGGTK
jgi:hypothetical protein